MNEVGVKMEKEMIFLSICIPCYNRPKELKRLLDSIDVKDSEIIEIVICDNDSPCRQQVRETVTEYSTYSHYNINYVENETNVGYDKNLRECIKHAQGKFVMFMGDDDVFIPKTMDTYLEFLKEHDELGYILRSYRIVHSDGSVEPFKYFPKTLFFTPGFDTYVSLFRKSVFISGFCFRREYALDLLTDQFDGSLLFQLFIQAEICMKYPSAYYSEPFTQMYDGGVPYFGNSEAEKNLYTPGTVTIDNSVNFVEKYFVLTRFMDQKYGFDSTSFVKKDMSKYSYPILSIQRKNGIKIFKEYDKRLRNLGLDCTGYYNLYYFLLLLLGEKSCDWGIRFIKKVLKRTPHL